MFLHVILFIWESHHVFDFQLSIKMLRGDYKKEYNQTSFMFPFVESFGCTNIWFGLC